jgi:hypothetical protein
LAALFACEACSPAPRPTRATSSSIPIRQRGLLTAVFSSSKKQASSNWSSSTQRIGNRPIAFPRRRSQRPTCLRRRQSPVGRRVPRPDLPRPTRADGRDHLRRGLPAAVRVACGLLLHEQPRMERRGGVDRRRSSRPGGFSGRRPSRLSDHPTTTSTSSFEKSTDSAPPLRDVADPGRPPSPLAALAPRRRRLGP